MENGVISPRNSIYILNTNYGSSDMMNFFTTPDTTRDKSDNLSAASPSIVQIQIPRRGQHVGLADVENNNRETLNDKTKKSLLKINLFIKRQWLSIFSDSKRSEDGLSSGGTASGKYDNAATTAAAISSSSITKQDASRLDGTNQRKCNTTRKYMSTKEMYREAARSLGINCSLSSSCRCYECQSHYFDCYASSTDPTTDEQTDSDDDDDDDEDDDCDSDCESIASETNDADHYITNCYLIHTEELCECCQLHNEHKRLSSLVSTSIQQPHSATQQQVASAVPPLCSLTDLAASTINNNDLNFNTTFFA